jgi:hypothetical protein
MAGTSRMGRHYRVNNIGCWVAAGCLFALGHYGLYAQQSAISWSSQSAGFGVTASSGLTVKSSVGQTAIGATMNAAMRIEGGFLADTSLRSVILAVQEEQGLPRDYALEQNYPNPFNPSTSIVYRIPASGTVLLKVYNMIGQEVATLVNELKAPGTYRETWNAGELPSGVYFYKLRAGSFVETKKLILVK